MTEIVIKIKPKDTMFLVASLLVIFSIGFVIATPNPGHDASQIGEGQFEAGNYIFPGSSMIGIGGQPTEKLHVIGSGNVGVFVESIDYSAGFKFKNDQASWRLAVDDLTGRALIYEDGQGERLTILEGGNIGIGNTNPLKKLDVAGEIVASGNIYSGGGSQGNMVCRQDGTSCPNFVDQLSCRLLKKSFRAGSAQTDSCATNEIVTGGGCACSGGVNNAVLTSIPTSDLKKWSCVCDDYEASNSVWAICCQLN